MDIYLVRAYLRDTHDIEVEHWRDVATGDVCFRMIKCDRTAMWRFTERMIQVASRKPRGFEKACIDAWVYLVAMVDPPRWRFRIGTRPRRTRRSW